MGANPSVAVAGAGFGGLCVGAHLKKAGIDDLLGRPYAGLSGSDTGSRVSRLCRALAEGGRDRNSRQVKAARVVV
jgi:ribosomal protein L18